MKKILLVLTVSAFAIGAYAGGPDCAKSQAACASKATAGTTCQTAKAGTTCQEAKAAACCEKSLTTKKNSKKVKVVHSPKAAGQSDRAS